jgi:NADPH:quinone reductase-like Zn-dependent oxidoreductase
MIHSVLQSAHGSSYPATRDEFVMKGNNVFQPHRVFTSTDVMNRDRGLFLMNVLVSLKEQNSAAHKELEVVCKFAKHSPQLILLPFTANLQTCKSTMSTKTKAIAFTSYGGPDVLTIQEVDVPAPSAGEVQIRVVGGGLNPVDYRIRSGSMKGVDGVVFPQVSGNELSGTISALGSGVSSFAVGDNVIVRVAKSASGATGSLAGYVNQPADIVARAPASTPLTDAAGLPLAGLTAWQVLDALDVRAGDRLLVTGGAGGVGLFAIQLAKLRGAHVSTTASDKGKPYVLAAGADEVIDYRSQKLADLAAEQHFDKVFDCAGGEEALATDVVPAVKKGGKIMSVAGPPTSGCLDFLLPWWKAPLINLFLRFKSRAVTHAAKAAGVSYTFLLMKPDGPQLQHLVSLVDEGKLTINIDSRFKFDDFAAAFKQLESGRSKGKVIIEFPEQQ